MTDLPATMAAFEPHVYASVFINRIMVISTAHMRRIREVACEGGSESEGVCGAYLQPAAYVSIPASAIGATSGATGFLFHPRLNL